MANGRTISNADRRRARAMLNESERTLSQEDMEEALRRLFSEGDSRNVSDADRRRADIISGMGSVGNRADGGTITMPEDLGYMVGGAMKEKKRGPIKYAAGGAVKGKKFSGIF